MTKEVTDISGTIAWLSATGMGLLEWVGGVEVNKALTTGSLLLGMVYIIYRIRTQRLELKLKQNEYEHIDDEDRSN